MNFKMLVFVLSLLLCVYGILTEDSVTVAVDAVIYARIFEANISIINVEKAHASKHLEAATTWRSITKTKNVPKMLSDWKHIAHAMQHIPICTSHSGLCEVTFEIRKTDPLAGQVNYTYSSKICDCPGQTTCPNTAEDPSRVYFQELSSPGQTITTKLSYCDRMSFPARDCSQYEVAMTLRVIEPIIADIVGDLTCKCSGALVLRQVMPDGMYSVREYTCGKPDCDVHSSEAYACERVSYTMSRFTTESEIPCQCPDGFICDTRSPVLYNSTFGKFTAEFGCELEP